MALHAADGKVAVEGHDERLVISRSSLDRWYRDYVIASPCWIGQSESSPQDRSVEIGHIISFGRAETNLPLGFPHAPEYGP
jgi:hypothetical protein